MWMLTVFGIFDGSNANEWERVKVNLYYIPVWDLHHWDGFLLSFNCMEYKDQNEMNNPTINYIR